MTYWAEAMQDDVYIVAQEGWVAARQIRELVKNSEGKFTEEPDLTIGKKKLKAELIPPPQRRKPSLRSRIGGFRADLARRRAP